MLGPAPAPTAVFSLPSVLPVVTSLLTSAPPPTATLLLAIPAPSESLNASAMSPTAVLLAPIKLLISDRSPQALLLNAVVWAPRANAPTALLKLPSPAPAAPEPVLFSSAAAPTATFSVPVLGKVASPVLNRSAAAPTAVFTPASSKIRVPAPQPVLKLPTVLRPSEYQPNPAFAKPPLMLESAWSPSAVPNGSLTLPGSGVSGAGRAFSENAKPTKISGMRRNPRHNGSERAGSRPHETNLLT